MADNIRKTYENLKMSDANMNLLMTYIISVGKFNLKNLNQSKSGLRKFLENLFVNEIKNKNKSIIKGEWHRDVKMPLDRIFKDITLSTTDNNLAFYSGEDKATINVGGVERVIPVAAIYAGDVKMSTSKLFSAMLDYDKPLTKCARPVTKNYADLKINDASFTDLLFELIYNRIDALIVAAISDYAGESGDCEFDKKYCGYLDEIKIYLVKLLEEAEYLIGDVTGPESYVDQQPEPATVMKILKKEHPAISHQEINKKEINKKLVPVSTGKPSKAKGSYALVAGASVVDKISTSTNQGMEFPELPERLSQAAIDKKQELLELEKIQAVQIAELEEKRLAKVAELEAIVEKDKQEKQAKRAQEIEAEAKKEAAKKLADQIVENDNLRLALSTTDPVISLTTMINLMQSELTELKTRVSVLEKELSTRQVADSINIV